MDGNPFRYGKAKRMCGTALSLLGQDIAWFASSRMETSNIRYIYHLKEAAEDINNLPGTTEIEIMIFECSIKCEFMRPTRSWDVQI